MSARQVLNVLGIAVGVVLPVAACATEPYGLLSEAPDTSETDAPQTKQEKTPPKAPSGAVAPSSESSCTGRAFASPNLASLTACNAGGHCYAKAKVPDEIASGLGPCANPSDVCVPDEILRAAGNKLASCTQPDAVKAATGDGGGCVNLALFPEAQKQAGAFLKQQECAPGLVCMPCKNPLDNKATPFCSAIGVYDQACGDVTDGGASLPKPPPAQACCTTNGKSNGICMSTSILPADKKDSMPRDTCPADNACMPAALFEGKPTTCNAGVFFGKGICMDTCFNPMLEIAGSLGLLSGKGCGETELCAPCQILLQQTPPGVPVPGCS
jgi:hypothetical protein